MDIKEVWQALKYDSGNIDLIKAFRRSMTTLRIERLLGEMEADKARIAELEAQLKEKPFSPDWDRLQACRDSVKEHQQMVRDLRAQLKTAKRDAVLEAVEKVPSYAICGSHAGEGGAISAVDVLDLINYANTIGKE